MSKVFLLDANVMIALATPDHTSHQRATNWFRERPPFATCPITQGTLLRFYMQWGEHPSIQKGKDLLRRISALPEHEFWPDDANYLKLPERGVTGHRQVTDAYLVLLAASHEGVLATMDQALAAIHPGVELI